MPRLPLPHYSSSRHPIETWQEWYRANQSYIRAEVQQQAQYRHQHGHSSQSDDIRLMAPYEYTDSLNQRQVWEPYLTGRERQEFDSQLRTFMKQNRSTMLRLRPGPISPPQHSSSSSSSSSHHHHSSSSSRHQSHGNHHHHSSSSAPRSSGGSSSRRPSSQQYPQSSSSSSSHHRHAQQQQPQYYTRH